MKFLVHILHCGISSNGTFNIDILTFDEQIDEDNVILTGLLAIEFTGSSFYIHFMGVDIIDTLSDKWFLP